MNQGKFLVGPNNEDDSISGSMLGSPYFGKLPNISSISKPQRKHLMLGSDLTWGGGVVLSLGFPHHRAQACFKGLPWVVGLGRGAVDFLRRCGVAVFFSRTGGGLHLSKG